jgi:predicted DNA-binding protein (UPF0251 family)
MPHTLKGRDEIVKVVRDLFVEEAWSLRTTSHSRTIEALRNVRAAGENPNSESARNRQLPASECEIVEREFFAWCDSLADLAKLALGQLLESTSALSNEKDPIAWAEEQAKRLIAEELGSCDGQILPAVDRWYRRVCDGIPRIEREIAWKQAWCAPAFLQQHSILDSSETGERLSVKQTNQFLASKRFIFRGRIEYLLQKSVRLAQIKFASRELKQAPANAEVIAIPNPHLASKRTDLSEYLDGARLTEKQRRAYELVFEYGFTKTRAAQHLNINRKTLDEHIEAANVKIQQASSKGLRRKQSAVRGGLSD